MSRARPLARTLAAAAILLLAVAAPCAASAVHVVDPMSHTVPGIRARWASLQPTFTGSPYLVTPSVVAPYAAGSLKPGFLADGINTVNFCRYLTGLPDDVVLDAALNSETQHAAVLMKASSFGHFPPKPADMSQAFYDLGYAGTSSSNIGWGHGTLDYFNKSCMEDDDSGNIDRVGHRRWLLNPPLGKTGMGWAEYLSATHAFDWSRSEEVSYAAICWPAPGYFPIEFFGDNIPWSVTVNPARYTVAPSGRSVTLTRASDGRVWEFDASDTDKSGEYFNVELSGYGVSNCFIFRPGPSTVDYRAGGEYHVTVRGLYRKGTTDPVTVTYTTTFMSLAGDTVAPSTVTSGVPAGWSSREVTVALAATDQLSDIAWTRYRVGSGAAATYTAPFVVEEEGATTIAFHSADVEGNVEQTKTVDVRIDMSSPVTTASVSATYPVGGGLTIGLTPSDALSGVLTSQWRIDGGGIESGSEVRVPFEPGVYLLEYRSIDRAGNRETTRTASFEVTGTWSGPGVTRVEGADRYAVAANMAQAGWNVDGTWGETSHVIVACGETGKEADPLAAAGLAGVYGAPLLLVRNSSRIPPATRATIEAIVEANGPVAVHIVGGTASVPSGAARALRYPGVSKVSRISGADRYEVTANIAKEMASVVGADAIPGALIICGEKPAAFYDALAVSPAAYTTHMPMLAVRPNTVPPSVLGVLKTIVAGKPRYAVSGPTYIAQAFTRVRCESTRLATSTNRYTAATQIASAVLDREWGVRADEAGVASKLSDSLGGGTFMGRRGGIFLYTATTGSTLQPTTRDWVDTHSDAIRRGWVFGAAVSVSNAQATDYAGLLP